MAAARCQEGRLLEDSRDPLEVAAVRIAQWPLPTIIGRPDVDEERENARFGVVSDYVYEATYLNVADAAKE